MPKWCRTESNGGDKVKDYKGRKRLRRKEGTKKGIMEWKDNHNRGGVRRLSFVLCQQKQSKLRMSLS